MAFAEILAAETRQAINPAKLIAPMLAWFMATDRAFAKARRNIVLESQSPQAAE